MYMYNLILNESIYVCHVISFLLFVHVQEILMRQYICYAVLIGATQFLKQNCSMRHFYAMKTFFNLLYDFLNFTNKLEISQRSKLCQFKVVSKLIS